jgi:hypothetical protein
VPQPRAVGTCSVVRGAMQTCSGFKQHSAPILNAGIDTRAENQRWRGYGHVASLSLTGRLAYSCRMLVMPVDVSLSSAMHCNKKDHKATYIVFSRLAGGGVQWECFSGAFSTCGVFWMRAVVQSL